MLDELDEEDVREAARKFKRGASSRSRSPTSTRSCAPTRAADAEIMLEELGDGVFVCTSCEVLPEIREFERTSTVAANAYLAPVIERYLDGSSSASRGGYGGELLSPTAAAASCRPRAARSVPGPHLPVRPCRRRGRRALGRQDGRVRQRHHVRHGGNQRRPRAGHRRQTSIAPEWRIDLNIPILFPAIDLVAIGAGGGTIAWVDAAGSLRAGPRAQAPTPGPPASARATTSRRTPTRTSTSAGSAPRASSAATRDQARARRAGDRAARRPARAVAPRRQSGCCASPTRT